MAQNNSDGLTRQQLFDILDEKKRQDNKSSFVERAERSQIENLKRTNLEAERYQSAIGELTKALNATGKSSPYRDELSSQIKELTNNLQGILKRKDDLEKRLRQANQEQLISIAEDELIAQKRDFILKQKELQVTEAASELDKARRQLAKAQEAGVDQSSELYKSLIEKQKKAQAKYEMAQGEFEDPDILNEERYKSPSLVGSKGQKAEVLNSLAGVSGLQGTIGDTLSSIKEVFIDGKKGPFGETLGKLTDSVSAIPGIAGAVGKAAGVAVKILDVIVALRKSFDAFVNEAASVLAQNVGRINAALEGSGESYASTTESMLEALGVNRYVQQTDYIAQIANLTTKGIAFNVEQRALLETIKDKTVASFSSMDAHLLRLVRLKQTDLSATQFGLEAALRNTLNKVFKDSSYLYDMYDTIASAITDSVVISGSKDVTAYSSVIQTWMGAMYESGVDSSMVSKIAGALNSLGSGNVSALASDQDIQRLILLSMDTIGMDYADVLQQGLTTTDINDLLTAIVKYLTKIESNTKDNNVLTSSYTNLFGMSMSDLQAFKNLSKSMSKLSSVDSGSALAMTSYEIEKLQSQERTTIAEQIDNFFNNSKFTFGNEIAKDGGSYISWKVSNLLLDITESIASSDALKNVPFVPQMIKAISIPAALGTVVPTLKGLFGLIKAGASALQNMDNGGSLQTLINGAPTYNGNNSVSTTAAVVTNSNFKTVSLSSLKQSDDYTTTLTNLSGPEWESMDQVSDPVVEELTKFESVIVTANADAKHKALATFLVGMTDDTLRSFASIFADEDSMSDTFTGKNEVLKDNMFKYAEDTSSNSKKKTTTTNGKIKTT